MMRMKAGKCPSESFSHKNKAILHPQDAERLQGADHILIASGPGENQQHLFSVHSNDQMLAGQVGFSLPQRKWASVDVNQEIEVSSYRPDSSKLVSSVVIAIDFYNKKKITQDNYDTDQMAREFLQLFPNQCFTVGQPIIFPFLSSLAIKEIKFSSFCFVYFAFRDFSVFSTWLS